MVQIFDCRWLQEESESLHSYIVALLCYELLSPNPSFVIADAGDTGLLCRVSRHDPCCGGDREVILLAQPVRVDLSGSTIPMGEPAFDLRLGIDCGYLYSGEGGMVDTATTPVLTGLEGAINGQVLDALAERWLTERGKENRAGVRRTDWDGSDWQPGQPVAWEGLFETLREDNLHGVDGCYAVFDLYFIDQDEPREVILDFAEGPHGPTADVGGIRIGLDSGETEFLPNRGKAKLLRRLWGRYRQRYPEFSHLEVRWTKMREILG